MTVGRDRSPSGAIAPTTVRIPPDLRDALQREADINRKTLSAEIVERLKASLEAAPLTTTLNTSHSSVAALNAAEPPPAWPQPQARQISDAGRLLLSLFDTLPPEKQLALLTVLKR